MIESRSYSANSWCVTHPRWNPGPAAESRPASNGAVNAAAELVRKFLLLIINLSSVNLNDVRLAIVARDQLVGFRIVDKLPLGVVPKDFPAHAVADGSHVAY